MYHSIAFGNKNTWDDFYLVPSTKPIILPPEVKTKIVDIPGGDGVIDLTESLTGYPVFANREGSFTFIVANDYMSIMDTNVPWEEVYQKLMNYIHGRKMKIVLEDDPKYYYEGRLTIADPKSYVAYAGVTVNYDLGPFKWSLRDSVNAAPYDPFNAWQNVPADTKFSGIAVNTNATTIVCDEDDIGVAPISPIFIVSSSAGNGVNVSYVDSFGETGQATIPDGSFSLTNLTLYRNTTITLSCTSGTATVSIKFRKGML